MGNVCKRVDYWWKTGAKGRILSCVPCAKLDPQRCNADHCPLKLSIKLRMTSSMCRCLNWPISILDVAVMGCQSSCNQGVQHMQLHGQLASISKMWTIYIFLIRGCSSRNTVQFLTEIDRNHECQLRKSWGTILLINIGLNLNATEENTCNYTYAVLYYLVPVWKLFEFPAIADDLHSYDLQCLRKDFN